jgi:hypothetical protein
LIETTISPSADFDSPRKNHSLETRPGGSIQDPADPGLELGRVEEKIEEGNTRCDLADLAS